MQWCLCGWTVFAAFGKGDGDTAGMNVTEVTGEWSIVAGGATVR
jgi:hypothetical protein